MNLLFLLCVKHKVLTVPEYMISFFQNNDIMKYAGYGLQSDIFDWENLEVILLCWGASVNGINIIVFYF